MYRMFWPLFVCFSPYLGVWGGGGGAKGSRAHNLLLQFSGLGGSKMEITSQRLLDQSQAAVCRGKRHIPAHFGLIGPMRVPYPKGLNCQFNPL